MYLTEIDIVIFVTTTVTTKFTVVTTYNTVLQVIMPGCDVVTRIFNRIYFSTRFVSISCP